MAARWFDGFEQYGADEEMMLDGLWGQVEWQLTTAEARTGDRSLMASPGVSRLRRSLGGDFTTVGAGCGFLMSALPSNHAHTFSVHQFRNVENRAHISVSIGTTGRVRVHRGGRDTTSSGLGTLLGESTLEMAPGVWNHIETKVVLSDTVGSVEVRVNGKVFVNLTNQDTIETGIGSASIAQFASGHFDSSVSSLFPTCYMDDIVVWDDSGTYNNDFVGMQEVHYLRPIADVAPQDWQLTQGVNAYELINDIPPDDDLDYIFSDTVGDEAVFTVEALPLDIVSIAAIAPIARAKKTDSGDSDVALGIVSGAVEEMNTGYALTTDYGFFLDVMEEDPNTTDVWNPSALPNIKLERTL